MSMSKLSVSTVVLYDTVNSCLFMMVLSKFCDAWSINHLLPFLYLWN